MSIKDRLTKPLYKHSFDGDSLHTYILFEDMDTILEEQAKIVKEYVAEVLKLAAEKAKIIDEDGDTYNQPHVFYCHGEEYKTWVDKDSILNIINEL